MIGPVILHQSAVIHRGEQQQLRPGGGVAFAEFLIIQVKADRHADCTQLGSHGANVLPGQNILRLSLIWNRIILIIDAGHPPLPVQQIG